jgi:predicted N-acetyltransferase YhbS
MRHMAVEIRAMTEADLPVVARVTDAAFGRTFPRLLFSTRFTADPEGCFIAAGTDGIVMGALISVARGSLAWFGPLAVDPTAQRCGVGQALVTACLEAWRRRGVRLMGLETFADSPFHVSFYGEFGFRPAWTGIAFQRDLVAATEGSFDGVIDGPMPDISFVYPGLDVATESVATRSHSVGATLTTEGGMAICHTASTFEAPEVAFIPFLAAQGRAAFDRLLNAAVALSAQHGCSRIVTRVPGASWVTIDGLVDHGFRAGRVMVRMKAGADLDYDRSPVYYCDSWL